MVNKSTLAAWLGAAASEADFEALYRAELPRVYNFFRYRLGDDPLGVAKRAREVIGQLGDAIRQAAQQIAASVHQQSVGMDQIAEAMRVAD